MVINELIPDFAPENLRAKFRKIDQSVWLLSWLHTHTPSRPLTKKILFRHPLVRGYRSLIQ